MAFIKPKLTPKPAWLLTGIAASLFFIYHLVYIAGGSSSAVPHLFYLPIIFTALTCSWKCSLFTAFFSGLLMSEWLMPLSTDPYISQSTHNWVIRFALFVAVSLWTSIVFEFFNRRSKLYQEQFSELSQVNQASLHALVDLAELRDSDVTGKHLNRLEHYAKILTEHLELDEELASNIMKTIALHDIGKVAVPDYILNKPGPLNDEEWKIMKEHPIRGAYILDSIHQQVKITNRAVSNYLKTAREIVLHHHEKYDGSGYPYGLKGKNIPLSARIAAICDVYDSLRSKRPYKPAYTHEEAVDIIAQGRGSHFDPELVDAFMQLADKFDQTWEQYGTSAQGLTMEQGSFQFYQQLES
ncbi:MAG: HD domain-containing protein [Firmicutes bacterium]|nr:HD domain-containing protein [Bacillota bacterium]